ncbi:MAG: hypothetical protein AAF928_08745 [Myxococcota bacterium]
MLALGVVGCDAEFEDDPEFASTIDEESIGTLAQPIQTMPCPGSGCWKVSGLDRDNPSGSGDYESYRDHGNPCGSGFHAHTRMTFADGGPSYGNTLPNGEILLTEAYADDFYSPYYDEGIRFNHDGQLLCRNADSDVERCRDMRVTFLCQSKSARIRHCHERITQIGHPRSYDCRTDLEGCSEIGGGSGWSLAQDYNHEFGACGRFYRDEVCYGGSFICDKDDTQCRCYTACENACTTKCGDRDAGSCTSSGECICF